MMHNNFKDWKNSSYLSKNNQSYVEKIYEDFLNDPYTVSDDWRKTFTQLSFSQNFCIDNNINLPSHNNIVSDNISSNINTLKYAPTMHLQILQLINAFRTYGHQYARLDPLNLWPKIPKNHLLKLEYYKFNNQDFKKKLDMKLFGMHQNVVTLLEIYEALKKIYCGSIGIEYIHILDINIILWIQQYFESVNNISSIFTNYEKKQFLKEIIAAEGIERYLSTMFPGVKRFSLEGSDVLIPMLKEIIRYSVYHHNVREIFLGMTHRGRLNVLVNVFGKNPQDLFNEFSAQKKLFLGSGDVKYHQGFYSDITINGNTIHLSLLYNPSHLEIVGPVVMGTTRARIDQMYKNLNNHYDSEILPIKIHGDAAISAQGVVQETFNMSKTRAYDVGGTIHIIINNQIGFTTSNICDIRSTQYCTDIAKMVQSPIFHVNADDVESVIFISRAALNFRKKFKRDVIIDLICYRRHGHNEADEPSVTQPLMYQKVRNHPTLLNIYSNILNKIGIVDIENNTEMIHAYRKQLEIESCVLKKWTPIHIEPIFKRNNICKNNNKLDIKNVTTQSLKELAYRINDIPLEIMMHSRVKKIYQERLEMASGNRLFDWGGAETLAYAVLLNQGISIRLSGEDAVRGTFFHRHAIIYNQNNGEQYVPLKKAQQLRGSFSIWDSVLSEEAALAFEYGYSCIAHNMLVIWEAQFGDFSNGAQVVIDQFISSGEQKWGQLCGLIMFLPHGYEGQGPEHSSARVERYLQLCAEYNMQVCIPSTSAQIYHILLKQAMNNAVQKKPLIVISPKSLLRHPMATASIEELACGSFQTILHDQRHEDIIPNQIYYIILCTGKIYYDLLHQRNKHQKYTILIFRVEQLYPFPYEEIENILATYVHIRKIVWCQEEPENQGAWHYIKNCFCKIKINVELSYVGRPASAAPAVGYFNIHQEQQTKLIHEALNLC